MEVKYLRRLMNLRFVLEAWLDFVGLTSLIYSKTHFYRLLEVAKATASEPFQGNGEPSGPRIKLNMKTPDPMQKIKLRLPGQKNDKQASEEPQVTVDNESLRRQREHVNAGADTSSTRRIPFSGSSGSGSYTLSNLGQIGNDRNRSASVASPALSASAIKPEVPRGQTPVSHNAQSRKDSQASDAAASVGSNAPPPTANLSNVNAHPSQTLPQAHSHHDRSHRPTSGIDSRFRPAGKGISLLTNFSIVC
jgi:hypothetical protein